MFRFELAQLVRRGVEDLTQDVEYLEGMLSAVKDVRQRFQDLDMDLSWDGEVDGGEPAGLSASVRAAPVGPVTGAGGSPLRKSADYPSSREGFASALHDAGVDESAELVDLVKLWASVHGGILQTRDAAAALIAMDLSGSTMENLPGYLARKARNSGEFERLGKGGGLYRWLHYREPVPQDGVSGYEVIPEVPVTSDSSWELEGLGRVVRPEGEGGDVSLSLRDGEDVVMEVKGESA